MKKIALLGLVLVLGACSGAVKKDSSVLPPQAQTVPYAPEKSVITLDFAGDVTLGDYPESSGETFNWQYAKVKKDAAYFMKNILPLFSKADLAVVNFEGTLTNAKNPREKEYRFKGPAEYAQILKAGGVWAVNVSNNHSMDYGEQGFEDTKKNLASAGIAYFGYDDILVLKLKGQTLCFNGLKGFDWERDSALLKSQFDTMKGVCSVIITTFHWGEERAYKNDALQEKLGHLAVDLGADLVIGHHPHVVQNIAKYKDAAIVYSLGNFVFGGNKNPADKRALIYHVVIEDGKIVRGTPLKILISSDKTRNNYQPVFDCDWQKEINKEQAPL